MNNMDRQILTDIHLKISMDIAIHIKTFQYQLNS